MTLLELKSRLPGLEAESSLLARAVEALDPRVLDFKPEPRKWSIRQIMAHLADMEILYGYRMRQIIADHQPVFAPIDQDCWADHLHYAIAPVEGSLALFRANRLATIRMLALISEVDLEKGAFHPEKGRKVTLAELVGMMLGHVTNHLGQVERLKHQAQAAASGSQACSSSG